MMVPKDPPTPRQTGSLDEVLARVLDRGIVIDASVRIDVAGLSLVGIDAHFVVASIDTFLELTQDDPDGGTPVSWLFPNDPIWPDIGRFRGTGPSERRSRFRPILDDSSPG